MVLKNLNEFEVLMYTTFRNVVSASSKRSERRRVWRRAGGTPSSAGSRCDGRRFRRHRRHRRRRHLPPGVGRHGAHRGKDTATEHNRAGDGRGREGGRPAGAGCRRERRFSGPSKNGRCD